MENYEACVTDRQGNCIRWSHVHAAPPPAAPDDAVREVTPAARERDVHRDLRAGIKCCGMCEDDCDCESVEACLSDWRRRAEDTATALDAALAGERAAREALARVEALIDQPAPDGWVRYRVLVSDLRAALSPRQTASETGRYPSTAPPAIAEQEPAPDSEGATT